MATGLVISDDHGERMAFDGPLRVGDGQYSTVNGETMAKKQWSIEGFIWHWQQNKTCKSKSCNRLHTAVNKGNQLMQDN